MKYPVTNIIEGPSEEELTIMKLKGFEFVPDFHWDDTTNFVHIIAVKGKHRQKIGLYDVSFLNRKSRIGFLKNENLNRHIERIRNCIPIWRVNKNDTEKLDNIKRANRKLKKYNIEIQYELRD